MRTKRTDRQKLFEKYRPDTFQKVIGQKEAVQKIKRTLERGWGGRAFWIAGASGIGKTTLARIIADVGANKEFVVEYDSALDIDNEELKDLDYKMHHYGGSYGRNKKTGRAYIINEAHGLRQWIIQRLLGILERIPNHVVFVFTTTKAGQEYLFDGQMDAGPLLSRCTNIQLRSAGLEKPFAKRCQKIAQAENLDGKPMKDYLALARDNKNNLRTMLQEVETGAML